MPKNVDALLERQRISQLLVPGCYVLVRVVQPERQVKAPGAAGADVGHRYVVPLVAALSGRTAGATFVGISESHHAGEDNQPGYGGQDVCGRQLRSAEKHDVEVSPDHQSGDEAPGDQDGAVSGEPALQIEFADQLAGLVLQSTLPTKK